MDYTLISNSCVSAKIYQLLNPGVNKLFVDYTNPFIASWFPEDEQYVRFCEHYDHYTSLEPRFGEPKCFNWYRDTRSYRNLNRKLPVYPVMFLGDIEIHWIHETSEKLLMKKYRERLKVSKELEPVFLWSDPEMFNIHSEEEERDLFYKFCDMDRKTIFLTKDPQRNGSDGNTRVIFVPEWEGKSQFDRYRQNFMNTWYNHPRLAELFKLNMYADHSDNV